ncbi:hypothetical protein [Leptolyngbya ohadii]|uniref:hypothetical protein n=1 Tax=Leptolyngbya ohadii TaxID=1962290 RepID=UPI0015C6516C|nr:hypothetical protein [Leptolyngbya ohadii]
MGLQFLWGGHLARRPGYLGLREEILATFLLISGKYHLSDTVRPNAAGDRNFYTKTM